MITPLYLSKPLHHNLRVWQNNKINFNSSIIPSCWKTISKNILHTAFVNVIWRNATEPVCILCKPTES